MGMDETFTQLSGHQGAIYDAAWNADTCTWMTAGGDGIVAEWSQDGSGEGKALLHHDRAFFSVGSWAAERVAGTENGELFRWTSGNAASARRIEAHQKGVFACSWNQQGQLFTGGGDERIVAWRSQQIDREWTWHGAQKIRCIVPSEAGTFIGTSEGRACISTSMNTIHSLQEVVAIKGHDGGTYAAIWHAQKGVWISGGRDGHLRVWRPDGSEVLSIPAHEGAIYRLILTPSTLWSASRDASIKAWDASTLSPCRKIGRREGGGSRSINALQLNVGTPSLLLFGGDDRTGRLVSL